MEHNQQQERSSTNHGAEHSEVQEWRHSQAEEDKSNAPFIRKRLRSLDRKLSEIDAALSQSELDWQELYSRVSTIEQSLAQILEQTGEDPRSFDLVPEFT